MKLGLLNTSAPLNVCYERNQKCNERPQQECEPNITATFQKNKHYPTRRNGAALESILSRTWIPACKCANVASTHLSFRPTVHCRKQIATPLQSLQSPGLQ